MTALRLALRLLRRDWRSGEPLLLAAALTLTVASAAAVGLFADRVQRAMDRQGAELIAADLAVVGSSPAPGSYRDKAESLGLATARTLEFATVILAGDRTQLVQAKAVDPAYPLRGRLKVKDSPQGPERQAARGPGPGEVWVEPGLLALLGLSVGDRVALGEARLRISAILSFEPDRVVGPLAIAPRVMLSLADIPATGLVTPASRVEYRLLLAGPDRGLSAFADWVRPRLPPNLGIKDGRTARPELEEASKRATRFLRLASLVTLLVAGSAIALSSRRLVEREIDSAATMRCLGAPRGLIARIFALRLLTLGVAAGSAGSLLGWIAQLGLAGLLGGWIGGGLPPPSLAPLGVAMGTGLVALLGFGLPPVVQVLRVPPILALRRELGPPRVPAILTPLAAAAALAVLAYLQAGDPGLAWRLLGGGAAGIAALAVAVMALVRLAKLVAGRARGVWRLGLAGLARRPGATAVQVGGLGLGILALLLLAVVRVDLLRTWRDSLPRDTPNRFLINVQPQEVAPLTAFLRGHGIEAARLEPMIRGRLIRIGDRPVNPDDYTQPRARQLAAREFNLSWAERPGPDNRIVAGRWWDSPGAPPQLSVERDIAERLGIRLGDRLTFWISDHEVSAEVTSLRAVRWDSFNVNFFVVAPPSLLRGEPATYITSFYLAPGRESLLADLVSAFPSVTPIDVDAVLTEVRSVVDRGVLAVEYVFLFTLAAGLLAMAAAIQASLEGRRAEHAILRTLGARRRALLLGVAVELTAAGLLAGLVASIFAELTGRVLADRLFGLAYRFDPSLWVVGVLGFGLAIGLLGTLAAYPLLDRPPVEGLRRGG